MEPVGPTRRPNLERLKAPIAWRPALQVGDSGYPLSKAELRALIRRARGTSPR